MITVMAKITAKKGSEEALKTILSNLVKQVASEEGTLEYILNQLSNDPCTFMVFEVYKDKAALDHHGSTDYFKAGMKEMAGLLGAKPQIEIYQEVTRINS